MLWKRDVEFCSRNLVPFIIKRANTSCMLTKCQLLFGALRLCYSLNSLVTYLLLLFY